MLKQNWFSYTSIRETYGTITGREEEKVVGNTQPQANRCDGGLGVCVLCDPWRETSLTGLENLP